jgi:hypothetical protein
LRGVANSSGREPGSYPGWSGFEPLATHHPSTPSWRNRQTHRSQKPEPAGHVRSTRTEGTNQQSGSSAAERRPHKAKAGGSYPPRTTNDIRSPRPSTTKEVCHETDRPRRRELSRSRANDAGASRLRRESSAVTAWSAARRSLSRSSAATIRAPAPQRGRFKRRCLRSGCY